MKSLLNKTLFQFTICTIITFLLATPLFYFLTRYFYAEDMIDIIEAVERGQKLPALDLERDILQGVMIQFFVIFAVLSCSIIVTLRFITKKIWAPFDDTLRKMEMFNLEQSTIPTLNYSNIKEFNRLNHSLSLLFKRNSRSYLAQKEFTENAAHELQTPLAIMQSKLEMLLQEDLNDRQSEVVDDLFKACNRMSRLNKNLLLLARIENSQFNCLTDINLSSTITRLLPAFESLCDADTPVVYKDNSTGTIVKGNIILLESLLTNLVVNAIRHAQPHSTITIKSDDNMLYVVNKAAAGPLNGATLFKRFQFTDDKTRGNGLGLAIVKAICDFHGWTIDYLFKDGSHCFCVTFPKT